MVNGSEDLTIRCGLEITYEAVDPTHIVLLIQPRLEKDQRMECEQLSFSPNVFVEEYADVHRNIVRRFELPPGRTTIRHALEVFVFPAHLFINEPKVVNRVLLHGIHRHHLAGGALELRRRHVEHALLDEAAAE